MERSNRESDRRSLLIVVTRMNNGGGNGSDWISSNDAGILGIGLGRCDNPSRGFGYLLVNPASLWSLQWPNNWVIRGAIGFTYAMDCPFGCYSLGSWETISLVTGSQTVERDSVLVVNLCQDFSHNGQRTPKFRCCWVV